MFLSIYVWCVYVRVSLEEFTEIGKKKRLLDGKEAYFSLCEPFISFEFSFMCMLSTPLYTLELPRWH